MVATGTGSSYVFHVAHTHPTRMLSCSVNEINAANSSSNYLVTFQAQTQKNLRKPHLLSFTIERNVSFRMASGFHCKSNILLLAADEWTLHWTLTEAFVQFLPPYISLLEYRVKSKLSNYDRVCVQFGLLQ